MNWFLIYNLASKYGRVFFLPISILVGFMGVQIERLVSDGYTPTLKSVQEKREERLLEEESKVESLKERTFIPKTIFEKNLSPSLEEPDPRLKKHADKC